MNEFKDLEDARKQGADCLNKQLDHMMDFYKEHYQKYFLPELGELMELCVKKLKDMCDHRNFETKECKKILCTLDSLLWGCLKEDVLHKFMETLTHMIVNLKNVDEKLQEMAVEVTRAHMAKSVKMVCEKFKEEKRKPH